MQSYDVVVYAATSAGVCAAVAAAELGAQVALIEPGRHVGGMTSGGLGYTDVGDTRVLGGMAARLRSAVGDHYGVAPGAYAGPEPHVAEGIYLSWLAEADVDVFFESRIARLDISAGRIQTAVLEDGPALQAIVFVDASYEGDLLAQAGVPYCVGRESRSLHGELHAGRQELVPGRHAMPPWISPFAADQSGEIAGPLLAQIKPEPMVDVGCGDGGVMSYGYRVCLSTAGDRVPFERRAGYDDAYWEIARRVFRSCAQSGIELSAGRLLGLEPNLPGGKADGNSLGSVSLSVLDGSAWRYPDADPAGRELIRLHHLHHAKDYLWFLSHDQEVPRPVRTEMQRWGLPADEFVDTGHLPHQLYVREARRMVGAHVLTERDLVSGDRQPDVVALGSYHMDVREVQRAWRWVFEHPKPVAMVFNEGYLSIPVPPYPIPYRSLVPRREDCLNLLVPVCLSASHLAFSSVRMEVQYQMLGHAAGAAAALAARDLNAVQDVDVSALQDVLRSGGQVLAV